MAQLKTTRTKRSVSAFIQSVRDPRGRADCKTLLALMKRASGEKPAMWGASIVGIRLIPLQKRAEQPGGRLAFDGLLAPRSESHGLHHARI